MPTVAIQNVKRHDLLITWILGSASPTQIIFARGPICPGMTMGNVRASVARAHGALRASSVFIRLRCACLIYSDSLRAKR